MTLRENIVAILETCFAGFRDEIIESCADSIMIQIERQADTPPNVPDTNVGDMISRQAAIEAVSEACFEWRGVFERCEDALKALPSAQPERKTGKWVRENIVLTSNPPQYQWHCSECGRLVHWFSTEILTNFCPNCGADMEGVDD